jgi:hypothetical protein
MTCTAAYSSSLLYANSIYTFTVTPSIAVPSDGFMKLNFPSIWSNSLSGPALNYSSCSSSTSVNCAISGNTITATSLVASTTALPFTFTLSYVVNPGTERANSDLSFTYFYANGSLLSNCQITISGLTSPTLTGVNFNITNNVGMLTYTNVLLPLATD